MEPAADWVPYERRQLASWSMEPAVGAPGLPAVEYVSIEMFGTSCHQASVSSSSGAQLVEYAEATQHNDPTETAARAFVVDFPNREMIINNPNLALKDAMDKIGDDDFLMRMKMHRFPASFRDPDRRYTVPRIVAIGPYYHGKDQLRHAENMKHAAVFQCIWDSGYSLQDVYDAVVSVAAGARTLYDMDVMARISDNDFLPMMFCDACFLVQYLLRASGNGNVETTRSLLNFFDSNDNDIYHDIMLLENQIPWPVVETVMRYRMVPLEQSLASFKDRLQDRKVPYEMPYVLDGSYQPPHLLGLLRFYIVGTSSKQPTLPRQVVSFSVSPNDLAEIGISIKANKAVHLTGMGIEKKGPFFAELCMSPLQLDERPSWLINMAALEICMNPNFSEVPDEESAVCSYLNLLTMLVHREADVYELRRKRILQGGGGFTDKEALEFFSSLQGLRHGTGYIRIMEEIQDYMHERPTRTKIHKFIYNNKTIIATFFSAIVALIGIFGTVKSLNFL